MWVPSENRAHWAESGVSKMERHGHGPIAREVGLLEDPDQTSPPTAPRGPEPGPALSGGHALQLEDARKLLFT